MTDVKKKRRGKIRNDVSRVGDSLGGGGGRVNPKKDWVGKGQKRGAQGGSCVEGKGNARCEQSQITRRRLVGNK